MKSDHYDDARIWSHSIYSQGFELERLKYTAGLIPKRCQNILDVGCGNGVLLRMLEKNNSSLQLTGLERSTVAIQNKACHTDIVEWNSPKFPFKDNAFDCVVTMALFEHVPKAELQVIIKEICRVTEEFIILEVPLNEMRVRVTCPDCGCGFDPHLHLRSYKMSDLAGIFPDFEKVKHVLMRGKEPLLSWCIRKFGIEMSAVYGGVKTCPQCGWTTEIEKTPQEPQPQRGVRGFKELLRSLIPDVHLIREAAVLYRSSE